MNTGSNKNGRKRSAWKSPVDTAVPATPGVGPVVQVAQNGVWLVPADQRPSGWESMQLREA